MITGADGVPVTEATVQRLLLYWAVAAWLYFLAICTTWLQVRQNFADRGIALALSVFIVAGMVPGYLLIRFLPKLRIFTSDLATAQGIHGIVCISLSYAILGPIRAIALLPLPVLLMFCAFSVSRKTLVSLAAFAVVALIISIAWIRNALPLKFQLLTEVTYLVAIANVVAVGVFLAEQFNVLRRRLKTQKRELATAMAYSESLAFRDELTKLPNRRYMQNLLAVEERRHADENSLLSVALLDIDYFKRVNDKFGHLAGDETLCKFATLLSSSLRTGDVLARWGGEEFLLLLPKTDAATAVVVVERLRESVNEHNLQIGEEYLRITFSAGLAVVRPGESSLEGVNYADKAMFEAKAAGRNAVRQFVENET